MSVVVTKSSPVVVRPSEHVVASGTIKPSSFDKMNEKLPMNALFVFEHPIHEAIETTKWALSQALVHYYPFAGRIVVGGVDGEGYIQCNGEGVSFVAASASCILKEVMLSSDQSPGTRDLLEKLIVHYPASCGPADPLLLVQVTEFSCSGFVLGVTWNHAIADGAGMAQFLQAIGEVARGIPLPAIVPARCDDSLPNLPGVVPIMQVMTKLPLLDDLAYLDFNVPLRLINHIRDEFCKRFNNDQPCSTFDAVTAVIWRCRTRAIMPDLEAPTMVLFGANVRKHVGAKEGYYGNCVITHQVMAKSHTVASGHIIDLVKMIKHSKEQIVDQIKNKNVRNPLQAINQQHLVQYNVLNMSSWRNIGFDEVDFGSGRPSRVLSCMPKRMPIPGYLMCLQCKAENGANVVSTMVKQEHAEAFLGELAKLM